MNKLYQDSGKWNKALEVCENHDRIHLRNTYYNYAKVSLDATLRGYPTHRYNFVNVYPQTQLWHPQNVSTNTTTYVKEVKPADKKKYATVLEPTDTNLIRQPLGNRRQKNYMPMYLTQIC